MWMETMQTRGHSLDAKVGLTMEDWSKAALRTVLRCCCQQRLRFNGMRMVVSAGQKLEGYLRRMSAASSLVMIGILPMDSSLNLRMATSAWTASRVVVSVITLVDVGLTSSKRSGRIPHCLDTPRFALAHDDSSGESWPGSAVGGLKPPSRCLRLLRHVLLDVSDEVEEPGVEQRAMTSTLADKIVAIVLLRST